MLYAYFNSNNMNTIHVISALLGLLIIDILHDVEME